MHPAPVPTQSANGSLRGRVVSAGGVAPSTFYNSPLPANKTAEPPRRLDLTLWPSHGSRAEGSRATGA